MGQKEHCGWKLNLRYVRISLVLRSFMGAEDHLAEPPRETGDCRELKDERRNGLIRLTRDT